MNLSSSKINSSSYQSQLQRIREERRQAAIERRQDDYRLDSGYQNLYHQEG